MWGKKQSFVRITFSWKTSQPVFTSSFLQNISRKLILDIAPFFLLELKKVDVRLKKKKMKFYKETLEKTLMIL